MITHLDVLLEKLVVAQASFEQVYSDYLTKLGDQKVKQTATEFKHEVLQVVNEKLVMYLIAMSQINPDAYGRFTRETAIAIDKTNTNSRERTKRNSLKNDTK